MTKKITILALLLSIVFLDTLTASNDQIIEIKEEITLHNIILETKELDTLSKKVHFIWEKIKPLCQYEFEFGIKMISPHEKKKNYSHYQVKM